MLLNELQNKLKDADLLYNAQQIKDALIAQANQINRFLRDVPETSQPPVMLPVMNGGLIYAGQLLPLITLPVEIDYIHATRYRNTTEGHELDWKVYPQSDLSDRLVIVLDDIFDEGHTLEAIVGFCKAKNVDKVLTSVLVTKDHNRRDVDLAVDFSALSVPDRYVFGYGMDYKGHLRNLDGIYAV